MKANGTDLNTYTTFQRLLTEGASGYRGGNLTIPNRHGEHSDFHKMLDPADFMLEVGIAGTEGWTNLSVVQRLLSTPQVTLERTTTLGTVEAVVELLGPPQPTQNRFVYVFPMRCPSGSWYTKTVSSASGNPPTVTTLGDRPIGDMVVTFSGVGTATHTDAYGRISILEIEAGAGPGTYVVDCGARTVTKGGVNQDRYFKPSQPWWWVFSPGATQTIASTVSITVDWHDRWAAG